MTRPIFIVLALAATVCTASAAQRPNVLVIVADDLGFSDLSCYGSEIKTPNIDRIARDGAKFTSFYTSARCCPSRASLITGLHPHEAGIGSFTTGKPKMGWGPAYTGHLLPNAATLPEILGKAGYSTWMVGKWHLGIPGPIKRGFQNYYGFKNMLSHSESQWDPALYTRLPKKAKPELGYADGEFYVTDVFTDYSLEFLKQARKKKDTPWFLYLAHSSPHFPIDAPKADIDKNMATYRKGWDVLRAARFERQKELGLMPADAVLPPRSEVPVEPDAIANGYSGVPNPAWDSLPADRREDLARRMATFAAMVQHVDQGVGRILADLEKNRELDNTLILFMSDNGACYEWGPFGFDGPSRRGSTTLHTGAALEKIGQAGGHGSYGSGWANLGNTPLNMYKHFCHEGGIASPLLVQWPAGFKARSGWVETPAHTMDIAPTVCAATGAQPLKQIDGKPAIPFSGTSLLAACEDGVMAARPIATEHQGARGYRKGDWKIVWSKRQPDAVHWELYNLRDDRSELHDLSSRMPELVAELVAEWTAWADKVGVRVAGKPVARPQSAGTAPKPLFEDPNYHGSCDPEVVWNADAKEWLIYYTARRATRKSASYVGTPIGVASSTDLTSWKSRGYASFDGAPGKPDMPDMPVTYWAPGIIRAGDTWHMFVTYKDNAEPPWGGKGVIRHYTAPASDPISGWKTAAAPGFPQPDPIDATLVEAGGKFRAYYRVGGNGGVQWSESSDLTNWTHHGKCPGDVNTKGRGYQEAPYVFRFGGFFWMITDPHKGLFVYRSDDGVSWEIQPAILKTPGRRSGASPRNGPGSRSPS